MRKFGLGKSKRKSDSSQPIDTKSLIKEGMDTSKYTKESPKIDTNLGNSGRLDSRQSIDLIGSNWPRQAVYHGSAIGVEWGQNAEVTHPLSEVDASVGINQEEALAAMISSEIQEDFTLGDEKRAEFEKYLVGFTHDLLGELETPDGEIKLEQELHRETFHSVSSGVIFEYVKPEKSLEPKISQKSMKKFSQPKKDGWFQQPGASKFMEYGQQHIGEADGKVRIPQFKTGVSSFKQPEQLPEVTPPPPAKVAEYAAPRYYETKDPVFMISDQRVSTRATSEGYYNSNGLTKVRTMQAIQRLFAFDHTPTYVCKNRNWLPKEIDFLIEETKLNSALIRNSAIFGNFFRKYSRGGLDSTYFQDKDTDLISPVALNLWRQAWLPILLDIEMVYHSEQEHWNLGESDLQRQNGFEEIATHSVNPTTITQRVPISRNIGKIVSKQIERFLESEDELDEDGNEGVLSNDEEEMFHLLKEEFLSRDLLSVTLSGIDDRINGLSMDDAVRAGMLEITQISIVDAFGQISTVNPLGLTTLDSDGSNPRVSVGLSLQNQADTPGRMILRPRIPKPSRLDFKLLAHDSDDLPSNSSSKSMTTNQPARTPVCGYLLPDHIEWAMEVFNHEGDAKGQLRVANRDWSLGGIQKGKLAWDSSPGDNSPAGMLPETQNIHMNRLLNSLMEIGMTDELETGIENSGEGALSAMLRTIDTSYRHSDPFGKGGANHPSFYMGRPVAVVRAKIRLQLEGGENGMSDNLKKYQFQVRLGSVAKSIDGLLGYFVNDDYSRFMSVLPFEQDGTSLTPSTASIDHDYVTFDNTIDVLPEQDVYLTLLMNPQASLHITSGILPQKEITLLRDHWEDALSRIAPTFKVGPVLVDPTSVRMPIDDAKPNLIWKWVHRESPSEWKESEIKDSDSLAGLPSGKMTAYEGWIKLDIDENTQNS